MNNCKVCGADTQKFAAAKILNRYDAEYFQCTACGFVQTEEPYWLEEAYSRPITQSDWGLVARNIVSAKLTLRVIANLFDVRADFLDYGAGYGMLVRLMRDMGFQFYAYDSFCENIFAPEFDVTSESEPKHYELVTAFELFEHLANPREELQKLMQFSKNILFSTVLLPPDHPKPDEWSYYIPHEGQHISFYTLESLHKLADAFNVNVYTNGASIHFFTEKTLPSSAAELLGFYEFDFSRIFEESRHTFFQDLKISRELKPDYGSEAIADGDTLVSETSGHAARPQLPAPPRILIDGVFFQLYKTGIARVWRSLFAEWAEDDFAKHLLILDRAGTAPKVPNLQYRTIPAWRMNHEDADREMLQAICDEEGADLFISTYFTTPISTPSTLMVYDMIPELQVQAGAEIDQNYEQKRRAIAHASRYITISDNTKRDLCRLFPEVDEATVTVALCGVEPVFQPASSEAIAQFKAKYGITRPYFMLMAVDTHPNTYKNNGLFFKAFSQLPNKTGFEIVGTAFVSQIHDEIRAYSAGSTILPVRLPDEELAVAYSGAIALVFPSRYEGFGLPVLEAMSCGCPVITTPNASIPEVGGDAVLYVPDDNPDALADALCEVQKPSVRRTMIQAGLAQAQRFSWSLMADIVKSELVKATLPDLDLKEVNLVSFPDWTLSPEALYDSLASVLTTFLAHPDAAAMSLLIDVSSASEDLEPEVALAEIVMNVMMEYDLDLTEEPAVALVGNLSPLQWSLLAKHIRAYIPLDREDHEARRVVEQQGLPPMAIAQLADIRLS